MTGRVIIVTGANSGIGYETARYLCEGGNDVILACRTEEKANRAIEKIKRLNPSALATYMNLDLNDLESIQKFVDDFHATEKKLHVLINNAGMVPNTKDAKKKYVENTNFETTVSSNHLGPFLLTNLLLDDLKKGGEDGGDARIINVTCSIHDPESVKKRNKHHRKELQPLDLENFFLFNESTYSGWQAYKNSKLMNVMFTYELAKQLEGSGVTANCVCPGYVPGTELMKSNSKINRLFARVVLDGMLRFTKMTRSVAQAALQVCNLATEEKFKEETGKYFKDGAAVKSSEESLNEENQKKLWELSGGYMKMEGFEPIEVPPPPVEEEEKKEEEEAAKVEEVKEEEKNEAAEETTETKTEEVKEEDKEKEPEDKEKEPEDKEKADVSKDEPEQKMEELEPEAKEANKEAVKEIEKVADKIEDNVAVEVK